MGSYVPVTPEERRAMLERIGLPSVEALYADVPEGVLLKEPPVFTGGFSGPPYGAARGAKPRVQHHSARRGGL